MQTAVIGVDIGGTKIAAHLSDGALWSAHAHSIPTPPEARAGALVGLERGTPDHTRALERGRAALLDALIGECRALLSVEGVQVVGVGIGSAGQIDTERGIVLDANDNLVGWRGTPLAETISAALGLPVFVENDVRAMALAEMAYGAGVGFRHVFCLTVGTGIGGALVLDGAIWHGAHYSAGEIGYIRVGHSTLEALYSGPGIEASYRLQQGVSIVTAPKLALPQIAAGAAAGDGRCQAVILSAAVGLGRELAPVLCLLDPEAVIVGGGVPESGDLWWSGFMHGLTSAGFASVAQMAIVRAKLGADAGRIGAGLLAARKLELL